MVTDIATELMGVNASTAQAAYDSMLSALVHRFGVGRAFLRHSDFERSATVLVAEWPPRQSHVQPDPLGHVHFSMLKDVFAPIGSIRDVTIFRPDNGNAEYREIIESASTFLPHCLIAVPLIDDASAVGFLGLAAEDDRMWSDDDISALRAIGALLTQLHTRVAAEEKLRFSALHDTLTGLLNRRALLEYLAERLDHHSDENVAILFLDLDYLKPITDFLGHLAGDEYVLAIARRLQQHSTAHVIARLDGDEFVVVLGGSVTPHEAEIEAVELLEHIGGDVAIGVERTGHSASIGIAFGSGGATTPEVLLRQADQAALVASGNPGSGNTANHIARFTDEMQAESELRNDVEIHLRSAIAGDSLVLHFQPEVNLVTGVITAVEALVRWQHPSRGLLPPAAFIPVAEATNLAGELGRWVLQRACGTLSHWRESVPDLDITMRVNVSPVQLVTADFAQTVSKILHANGIDGPSLCLEITEVAVVQDLARTRVTLQALRELGVHVAIDDFGTGYSSLSHLKELPVDALKIDRAFVTNLGTADADDLAIIKAIRGLAESFGLDVIAEGVETEVARQTLIELGCTRAQGYFISRPVPAEAALELLRAGTIAM